MIKRDLYYDRIPTKSLRNDVRYLGNILGKVIKNQEGEKLKKLHKTLSKKDGSIQVILAWFMRMDTFK
jgi:phosphoenolpyruvate carboxylase